MRQWKCSLAFAIFAAFTMLCGCKSGEMKPEQTTAVSTEMMISDEVSTEMKIEKHVYRAVSMETAVQMMEEESGYIILDVRTQAEFEEKRIPGAICIPNETIGVNPPEQLPDKDQLILVYCRSGNRSKQAAQKLADIGYSNIVEFGGIIDWKGETVSGK